MPTARLLVLHAPPGRRMGQSIARVSAQARAGLCEAAPLHVAGECQKSGTPAVAEDKSRACAYRR